MSVYLRGKYWWVKITFNGEIFRRPAKTTSKTKALEYEKHIKEELHRTWRGGKPRKTYSETALRFIDHYLPGLKPRGAERYMCSLRQLSPFLEGVYLDEINKAKIAEIVRERKKPNIQTRRRISDATIRRDLACLSSLLSCAVEWDWIETNPMKSYSKRSLKEAEQRVRYLSKEELKKLLEVAVPWVKPLIVFAVETGVRFEEQFSLVWDRVDLHEDQILLVDTKTRRDRVVPLSPLAKAQIRAQGRHPASKYVFYREGGSRYNHDNVRAGFERAVRDAGIQDFTWHDLRHTFASWARKGWHSWLKEKMPLDTLQKWLGHTTIFMTLRYAHLDADDLHASMRQGTNRGTDPTDLKKKRRVKRDENS